MRTDRLQAESATECSNLRVDHNALRASRLEARAVTCVFSRRAWRPSPDFEVPASLSDTFNLVNQPFRPPRARCKSHLTAELELISRLLSAREPTHERISPFGLDSSRSDVPQSYALPLAADIRSHPCSKVQTTTREEVILRGSEVFRSPR